METAMTGELQWVTSRPVTDLLRYRAQSNVDFRYGPQASLASLPFEYRDLPEGFDPRTRALAQQMMRDHPGGRNDKAGLVEAAMEKLRTGGYGYSLDPGIYGVNTADEFWFDRKEGFCEHIASAFVVLMRAMGIPARVVTGYQGGERNDLDGFWVLRQADAHAWSEVWLQGKGWTRVDPTSAVAPARTGSFQRLVAPQGVFAAAMGAVNPNLAASMRAAWEALNNGWNQWVLNYTQSKQLSLLKDIGFESPSWEDLSYVLLALIVIISLIGAAWTLWDRVQHDPWLRLLERARRRARQGGLELADTSPPRQIATAITARWGDDARGLANWLLKLEAQRYARASRASLPALAREFKQLSWPH
jgi:hypothetical protein